MAVGSDVHKRQCTVAVEREGDELGCFEGMENTLEGWRKLLQQLPVEAEIAVEVSTTGYFAMSVLGEEEWRDRLPDAWFFTSGDLGLAATGGGLI